MKRLLIVGVVMLAVGLGTGWYLGYTRPVSYYCRNFKAITGMTNQEIAEAARKAKNMTADMGLQESYVAAMSLHVLDKLESGQTDAAKQFLAKQVARYYRIYSKLQHPSADREALLARIEKAGERSPVLRTTLDEKPQ
jgi:hypothetical protein